MKDWLKVFLMVMKMLFLSFMNATVDLFIPQPTELFETQRCAGRNTGNRLQTLPVSAPMGCAKIEAIHMDL